MKPRIIVLEDDEVLRRRLSLLLKMHGYEVVSASDPTLCPVYSAPEKPCAHEGACTDFLLTDNRMPNMTGLEFVEVQTLRGCKGHVVNKAVMSGTWSQEDREKAERLGCKVFSKPFSIEEIIVWLDEQKKLIPADRSLGDLS